MLKVRALWGGHPVVVALVAMMFAVGAVVVVLWTRPDPAPPGATVRVWSWNALANSYEGPAGILDDRIGAIAEDAAEGADVVGFQEIHLDGAAQATERFGAEEGWLPLESECLDLDPGGAPNREAVHCAWVEKHDPVLLEPEGVAIVSRYEIRDASAEVLTGDTYGRNDPDRRVVVSGTVSLGDVDLRAYVTHLATRCVEQNDQASRIVELIEADRNRFEYPFSAVVMGDMNTTPQTKVCDEKHSVDEALYVFLDGALRPPWGTDPCVAFCDLATEDGLRRCTLDRDEAARAREHADDYEPCGFTLRRKESWDALSDPPQVPYQTVDHVLVDENARFDRYARPWLGERWIPGRPTPEQAHFEHFLAISDHVPVQTTLRLR